MFQYTGDFVVAVDERTCKQIDMKHRTIWAVFNKIFTLKTTPRKGSLALFGIFELIHRIDKLHRLQVYSYFFRLT